MLSYIDCIVSLVYGLSTMNCRQKWIIDRKKMRNIPKKNKSITLVSKTSEDEMDRKKDRKTNG